MGKNRLIPALARHRQAEHAPALHAAATGKDAFRRRIGTWQDPDMAGQLLSADEVVAGAIGAGNSSIAAN
jgi:hypothetical protein